MGGMLANLVRPETEQPQRIFLGHCPASFFSLYPYIHRGHLYKILLQIMHG